jgi:hypothetical protein
MFETFLQATSLAGTAALLSVGVALPLVLAVLVLAEQLQGLRRSEAQAIVPTAWKRALAGSWSLRGRVRLPRKIRLR